MKIKSHQNFSEYKLPVLLMDNLLSLVLGFILAFSGPFFLIVLISRRSRNTELAQNIIGTTYDDLSFNSPIYTVSFCIAVFFVLAFCTYSLSKKHLVEIELSGNSLILYYENYLKKKNVISHNLNEIDIFYNFQNYSEKSDAKIELFWSKKSSKKRILSTDKDKFWNFRNDGKSLLKFIGSLNSYKKIHPINTFETKSKVIDFENL